jgi:methyl-accepting chemotaxis protein
MPKPKTKRQQLLIDRKVQGALARRVLLHWAVFVTLVFTVSIGLRVMAEFNERSILESAAAGFHQNISVLLVVLALLPWFVRDTLQISNRFAGPITRLRRSMRDLAAGEETEAIQFRDGDFWDEVSGEFNILLAKHNAMQASIEALNTAASDTVASGRATPSMASTSITPVTGPVPTSSTNHPTNA